MSEQQNKSNQLTDSENTEGGNSKCRQDPFPPKLSRFQWVVLIVTYVFAIVAIINLVDQFCIHYFYDPCVCCTYITLAFLLAVLLIDRTIRNKIIVHRARLVDQSLVEATMVGAETVEPRLTGLSMRSNDYKKEIKDEVKRLRKLGNLSWTEYQVLSVNQMLVDFYNVDDLIANTRLSLAELEEYAEDSAIRYDREKFYEMKKQIDEAIKKTEEIDDFKKTKEINSKNSREIERDRASEQLRAELRTLLEHVADYTYNWTMGYELVRALTVIGVASIPILLVMGLLPVLHPSDENHLGILNWGLLGICGAITAVLLNLRKTNIVEVGNTEGKKELRNAILGSALGLVAGVLAYAMISGGLLMPGGLVPKLVNGEPHDLGLSIIWGVASGFSFEKIFDRMRSTTVGEN